MYTHDKVMNSFNNKEVSPVYLDNSRSRIYIYYNMNGAAKRTRPDYFFLIVGSDSEMSLEYFTLTSPIYLPRLDDGSSDAINVSGEFPFGSQNFSSLFVR